MLKKQPGFRLLLTLVIAFSMTMPATIIVGADFEDGVVPEASPVVAVEHTAQVQIDNVVYKAWVEGETHHTAIMLSKSDDGGRTWDAPVRITPDGFVPIDVQMSAGPNALHIVWTDAVSRLLRTGYMSLDIATGACTEPTVLEGENPSVTAAGDNVAVATTRLSELLLHLSEDNGQSFDTASPMSEIECTYPSVLFSNGVLHLASIGQAQSGLKGIFYTFSSDQISWEETAAVVEAVAWMKEISMTSIENGINIQWREVSEKSIEYYSVDVLASGAFGDKTLISSEPTVRETAEVVRGSGRLPPKKWTFICYLCADNNLDSAGYTDMTEMESIGSNLDLNIIVLFDGDTFSGPDTHCYYITPGGRSEIPLTEINPTWTGGELNMGNTQTAVDFVKYVYDVYPADRYMMDFWNHGGSWLYGMCSDDSSGDDLTMLEVRTIFETLRTDTGKIKLFDVAGYDECLMSDASVYYDEMPYIDYMCNSEDSIGNDGWEYDLVLGHLNDDLDMNGEEAAYWVFQSYVDAWGTSGSVTTMSVINSTMLAISLAPAINNLAQKGIHEITSHRTALRNAANGARSWQGYTHQRDLYHFCELAISSIPTGMVHNALQGVLDAAESNPSGTPYGHPSWQHDRAIMIHNQNSDEHGMTIYVNDPSYDPLYDTMTFTDTNWDEFYKVLWGSDANDPNFEPTVGITNPPDGGLVTKDSIVMINGIADDDLSVGRVDVAVHTQHWSPAIGTTSWSFEWDTTGWEPGNYKIMARSFDGQDYSAVDIHDVIIIDNLPPSIVLLDNNGQAEDGTWSGVETITWTATDPTEDQATLDIKLEYSPNGGGNWFTIEDGADNNDGQCLWDTKNVPDTTTYLLRATVTDSPGASTSDESDAVFTISNPPAVDLSSPDGGKSWMGGSAKIIWWNMTDSLGNVNTMSVDIYYSTNSGATYPNVIAIGLTGFASNPCSYSWDPIPYLDISTLKVKVVVTDALSRTAEDFSQTDFTIDSTAPAPATNAHAELDGTGVRIYWDASASPDIDHYEVFWIMNNWDPTGNSYTSYLDAGPATDVFQANAGILSAQSYFYQVRAYDLAGHETRSTIQAAKFGKTLSYSLNPSGWFLLGSPLVQSDTSLNHVIQGQNFPASWDYVMAWDASGSDWNSYLKTRPVNDMTDITNDIGFWLHTTGNARWTTAGHITDMAIPLKAGWNLVPYSFAAKSMSASAVESHLTANCPGFDSWEIFSSAEDYRLITPAGAEPLTHGDAFWVHVNADTVWTVTNY